MRLLQRRTTTWAAVCALILATLAVGPQASSSASPFGVDLANPAAGVLDPAAGLEPVDTECHSGQVDLNVATAGEIGAALGVASDPTVERIIDLRPWLKGSDLSSVPGIGPERIAEIEPLVCATPPVLPPPTPLSCPADASAVDLQTASASSIARSLGVPRKTAQAVVRSRPLPQDLRQIIAPRVPGLSEPKLSRLLDRGAICVRPAPLLAAGASFRWVTASEGAVISRGDYVLYVPPNRVLESRGAYASIAPGDLIDGIRPSADAHIYGAWARGTSSVVVQLPMPAGTRDLTPMIFHNVGEGAAEMSMGDALWTGAGTAGAEVVRVALTSLSEVESAAIDCVGLNRALDICGGVDWDEKSFADLVAEDAARDASGIPVRLVEDCPSSGNAQATGRVQFGMTCTLDTSSSRAIWMVKNTYTGGVAGELGIVYNVSVDDGPSGAYQSLPQFSSALLHAENALFPENALVKGESLTLPVSRGEEREVQADVDVSRTVAHLISEKLLGMFPQTFGLTIDAAELDGEDLGSGIKVAVLSGLKLLAASTTDAAVAAMASSLGRFVVLYEVAIYVKNAVDVMQAKAAGPSTVQFRFLNPPPPPSDPPPLGPDGTISNFIPGTLHRVGTFNQNRGRTVYQVWQPGGEAYGTTDEREIACLSRRHVLRDYLALQNLTWTSESIRAPEGCESPVPEIMLAPAATNWILRDAESGTAWFVDSDSRLTHIEGGNQYIACAQDFYVLDHAPAEMIRQFGEADPEASPRAPCG